MLARRGHLASSRPGGSAIRIVAVARPLVCAAAPQQHSSRGEDGGQRKRRKLRLGRGDGMVLRELRSMKELLGGVDKRLGGVDERLGGVEECLGGVEERLGALEKSQGGVEARLGALEKSQGGLKKQLDAVSDDIGGVAELMVQSRLKSAGVEVLLSSICMAGASSVASILSSQDDPQLKGLDAETVACSALQEVVVLGTCQAVLFHLKELLHSAGASACSHAIATVLAALTVPEWRLMSAAMTSALEVSDPEKVDKSVPRGGRTGLDRARGDLIALKKLADTVANRGKQAGMDMLKDQGSWDNPCLLLLSTAALGYSRPGARVMELDVGPSIKVEGDTIRCEVAEVKARKDGSEQVAEASGLLAALGALFLGCKVELPPGWLYDEHPGGVVGSALGPTMKATLQGCVYLALPQKADRGCAGTVKHGLPVVSAFEWRGVKVQRIGAGRVDGAQ